MSRFNETKKAPVVTNLAGGKAYKSSDQLALVSLLLTSFGGDQYYRSADETTTKLDALLQGCDPRFAAQAILYARRECGMRSITHVAASLLAPRLSGSDFGDRFFCDIVRRPDDMLEIVAFHLSRKQKLSASMKRGFREAIQKMNGYALAKYRGEGKAVKMVDMVNMLHPVPQEHNQEALQLLMKNELKNEATWEAMLTKAGQEGETAEAVADLKNAAWGELLTSKKLGYFALLRNLRNIEKQAPEHLDEALKQLVDPEGVKKSLMLPFRFMTAYEQFAGSTTNERKIMVALQTAADVSMQNVPKLPGNTIVVLDTSGSMMSAVQSNAKNPMSAAKIGAQFAAVLIKAMNADFMSFADRAQYHAYDPTLSSLALINSFKFRSGGTNFQSIFETLNKKYDRVIILSDMQAWGKSPGYGASDPKPALAKYRTKYGADPVIWSFDLQGYGTLQFPETKVRAVAGFSDKILGIMGHLEEDSKALVDTIGNYWK